MCDYKMTALAYNRISDSKGEAVLDRFFNSENGFVNAGDSVFISRYTKILTDIEKIKTTCRVDRNVTVLFHVKYDFHKPTQHDLLLGEICNEIKDTNIKVVVFLEFQQLREFCDLQDFQCDYGTDGGLEQFFSLIIAEQEYIDFAEVRILKNKFGGLYVL